MTRTPRLLVRLLVVIAMAIAIGASAAQTRQRPGPILILVSFDGWRWDYLDRAKVPNLKALAARGVRATELIPCFPSLTFPNHYTIVTGLYPEHHGIVGNSMWTPTLGRFSLSSNAVRNAAWWGGEPIWVTAIRQGHRAMDVFWPGGEAPIGGITPTRWWPFDGSVPNEERVARALDWLALPDGEQPSLVTLYFQEVDHVGHVDGPDSWEVLEAATHLDAALGQLLAGITRLGLSDRTDIVVVSDHGMTKHTDDMMIFLDDAADPKSMNVISTGEIVQVAPQTEGVGGLRTTDAVYGALHGKLPHLAIYRSNEVPAHYHYRGDPHMAPIVGVPDEGWMVTTREQEARRRPDAEARRGGHGYDPAIRAMHGLFVAAGPDVRRGLVVAPFQNIHIYDFLCAILHLKPAANDGDPSVTRQFLR